MTSSRPDPANLAPGCSSPSANVHALEPGPDACLLQTARRPRRRTWCRSARTDQYGGGSGHQHHRAEGDQPLPQPLKLSRPWGAGRQRRSVAWSRTAATTTSTPSRAPARRVFGFTRRLSKPAGGPAPGAFKFGWDAEAARPQARRSLGTSSPGNEQAQLARIDCALEMEWNYYGPFGFAAGLADADEAPYPLDMRVPARCSGAEAAVGTAEVTAAVPRMKGLVGASTPVPL